MMAEFWGCVFMLGFMLLCVGLTAIPSKEEKRETFDEAHAKFVTDYNEWKRNR